MVLSADVGIVTIVAPELKSLFSALGFDPEKNKRDLNGNTYWFGNVESRITGRKINIALSVLNAPSGNTDSAITTTLMIRDWNPRLLCLCGIAAGIEGKIRIGDVIIAEKIQDVTIKVLSAGKLRPRTESRGRAREINGMFKVNSLNISNLNDRLADLNIDMNEINSLAKRLNLPEEAIANQPNIHDGSIVSDNTLLRDASFFKQFNEYTDDKCRAGEMEAAGFARAAEIHDTPWLVVRGISDFGDIRKDDAFHTFAALRAAATLRATLSDIIDMRILQNRNKQSQPKPPIGSIEADLIEAFDAKRWHFVVEIGSLLSRPLWLAHRFDERIRIGRLVEKASAETDRVRERASALVDDIGWTTEYLNGAGSGRVFIMDGYNLASQSHLPDIACKAARHIASMNRRMGKMEDADHWLDIAQEHCDNIRDEAAKFEHVNRLKLSRAKALADSDATLALQLVNEARTAFATPETLQSIRHAETFFVEAEIHYKNGRHVDACSAASLGYDTSILVGRKNEALSNAQLIESIYRDLGQDIDADSWREKSNALLMDLDMPISIGA